MANFVLPWCTCQDRVTLFWSEPLLYSLLEFYILAHGPPGSLECKAQGMLGVYKRQQGVGLIICGSSLVQAHCWCPPQWASWILLGAATEGKLKILRQALPHSLTNQSSGQSALLSTVWSCDFSIAVQGVKNYKVILKYVYIWTITLVWYSEISQWRDLIFHLDPKC